MKAGERPNHPVELLSASIDGEIRPAEAAALEAHLEGCAECRGLLEDFRTLEGTIADEAPPGVPADLRQRILAGLASRTVAPAVPFWRQAMPLAAAASLLMAVLLWWGRPDRLPMPRVPEPAPAPAGNATVPDKAAQLDGFSTNAPAETSGLLSHAVPADAPPAAPGEIRRRAQGPHALPAPKSRLHAAPDAGKPAEKVSEEASRQDVQEELAEAFALPPSFAAPAANADERAGPPAFDRRQPAVDSKKVDEKDVDKETIERLRSLGYIGSDAGAAGSAAGSEAKEPARASAARSSVAAQRPEPTAMLKAVPAQSPGLFATPYTVRLIADRRMQVQSGPYTCTAAVDDVDGRRITAALLESERVRPASPQPAAPGADAAAADPALVNASAVIPATPEAREVILRLVRERYRQALEDRCGPLPN